MPSTGFLIPAARTIDAGSGTWTNDANLHADDGAEVTFSLAVKNTAGRWLRGQTFGFDSAIPTGVTITQVNLRMEYRVNSTGGIAQPQCQAFVSGVAVGAVRTASPLEPTVLTLNTFDVTADRAWTRADLLNGTFELRIRGNNGNSATDPSYRWDYIAVEVVYSTAASEVTVTPASMAFSAVALTVASAPTAVTVTPATVAFSAVAVMLTGNGPVRDFDGTDDTIRFPATGYTTITQGAFSIAALFRKPDTDTAAGPIWFANAAAPGTFRMLMFASGTGWTLYLESGVEGFGAADPPDDVWLLAIITKPAGTAFARLHTYNYATTTWAHTNTNNAIAAGSLTADSVYLGGQTGNFLDGRMAAAGIWTTALSDGDCETMEAALQAWSDLSPVWLVRLNQASAGTAVEDLIGTNDQNAITGTTAISNDGPPGFDFDVGAGSQVTLTPATLAFSAVALSPASGPTAVTLTPATLAITAVAVAPTSGPTAVTVAPATVVFTAVQLSFGAAPSAVTLTPAVLAFSAVTLAPASGPTAVTVTPATLAFTAVPLSFGAAPSAVTVTPAALNLSAVPLSFSVGPTAVTLTPAVLVFTAVQLGLLQTLSLTPATLTFTAVPLSPSAVAAFTPGYSTATVTLAAGGSSTITGPNGSASVSKRPTGAASIR